MAVRSFVASSKRQGICTESSSYIGLKVRMGGGEGHLMSVVAVLQLGLTARLLGSFPLDSISRAPEAIPHSTSELYAKPQP